LAKEVRDTLDVPFKSFIIFQVRGSTNLYPPDTWKRKDRIGCGCQFLLFGGETIERIGSISCKNSSRQLMLLCLKRLKQVAIIKDSPHMFKLARPSPSANHTERKLGEVELGKQDRRCERLDVRTELRKSHIRHFSAGLRLRTSITITKTITASLTTTTGRGHEMPKT